MASDLEPLLLGHQGDYGNVSIQLEARLACEQSATLRGLFYSGLSIQAFTNQASSTKSTEETGGWIQWSLVQH